jgi:hypothetical protein
MNAENKMSDVMSGVTNRGVRARVIAPLLPGALNASTGRVLFGDSATTTTRHSLPAPGHRAM